MARKKIDDVVEGRILALLQLNYHQPEIVKILKKDGIHVSQKTVSNVKRKIGDQRNSIEKIKFSRNRPVATQSIISKVIEEIDVENPPTQRSIAKSCHISQSTVSRIIKRRSNLILGRKQKVHKLTPSNADKRRRRAHRLYRQLAKHRYKNFVTITESWFYVDGTEGKRKVCYINSRVLISVLFIIMLFGRTRNFLLIHVNFS